MRVKLADLLHNTRHDRLKELENTPGKGKPTVTRLLKKYRPAIARLMLELEIIGTEEQQASLIATKPVGSATSYSQGKWNPVTKKFDYDTPSTATKKTTANPHRSSRSTPTTSAITNTQHNHASALHCPKSCPGNKDHDPGHSKKATEPLLVSTKGLFKGDWIVGMEAPILGRTKNPKRVGIPTNHTEFALANGRIITLENSMTDRHHAYPYRDWSVDIKIQFEGVTEDQLTDYLMAVDDAPSGDVG